MEIEFSWDPSKARANEQKHGVSFVEAMTVFADPLSLTILDPDHSAHESRFLIVGTSSRGRLLAVAHGDGDDQIRIIHARAATRRERHDYEEGR